MQSRIRSSVGVGCAVTWLLCVCTLKLCHSSTVPALLLFAGFLAAARLSGTRWPGGGCLGLCSYWVWFLTFSVIYDLQINDLGALSKIAAQITVKCFMPSSYVWSNDLCLFPFHSLRPCSESVPEIPFCWAPFLFFARQILCFGSFHLQFSDFLQAPHFIPSLFLFQVFLSLSQSSFVNFPVPSEYSASLSYGSLPSCLALPRVPSHCWAETLVSPCLVSRCRRCVLLPRTGRRAEGASYSALPSVCCSAPRAVCWSRGACPSGPGIWLGSRGNGLKTENM